MDKSFKKYLSFNSIKRIKNNDLLVKDDHLISYVEGEINVLNFNNEDTISDFPDFAGMFFYLILDSRESNKVFKALKEYARPIDSMDNLIKTYDDGLLDDFIGNHKRIVFLDYVMVKKEFRRGGVILNEFLKTLKREYTVNNNETIILANFQPIQYSEFFKTMCRDDSIFNYMLKGNLDLLDVTVDEYFEIDSLGNDYEYDTLKLHSLAQKNGFNVISQENNIFRFF